MTGEAAAFTLLVMFICLFACVFACFGFAFQAAGSTAASTAVGVYLLSGAVSSADLICLLFVCEKTQFAIFLCLVDYVCLLI
jgi:hypothetical protein